MVLQDDPDYPQDVWSSFYRMVNEGMAALRMSRPVLRAPGAYAGYSGAAGVAGAGDWPVTPPP